MWCVEGSVLPRFSCGQAAAGSPPPGLQEPNQGEKCTVSHRGDDCAQDASSLAAGTQNVLEHARGVCQAHLTLCPGGRGCL